MTEAILPHSASGLFSVFTNHSVTVQQSKKQLTWRLEWRQLSQNFSGLFDRKKLDETIRFSDTFIPKWLRQFFFRIFYHRCRAYLKQSSNFANILGKCSSRILAYRVFLLNSEWNFAILFLFINSVNKSCWSKIIVKLLLERAPS